MWEHAPQRGHGAVDALSHLLCGRQVHFLSMCGAAVFTFLVFLSTMDPARLNERAMLRAATSTPGRLCSGKTLRAHLCLAPGYAPPPLTSQGLRPLRDLTRTWDC